MYYSSDSDRIYPTPIPTHIFHSRAEKHGRKALQTFSKERWLDMGMSTMIFTVHIDEQGRVIGDV